MLYKKMECLVILFVMAIVFVAEYFHIHDVIFPEIAALAFGAWVLETRPWPGPVWTIWFSPTLGAITGVAILYFVPYTFTIMAFIALIFVLIELKIARSSISPSISAAILPMLINAKGLVYPVAVCLTTGTVALIAAHREKQHIQVERPSCDNNGETVANSDRLTKKCFHYSKIFLAVLAITLLADKTNVLYIVSPPLIVVFFELAHPQSVFPKDASKKLFFMLTCCALEGMFWVALVVEFCSGPRWIAAGLSMATALSLSRLFRLAPPPAFALALLPLILPSQKLYSYPASVVVGAFLFIVFARFLFDKKSIPLLP
ncbi:HPP family protein [Desulfovibrio sp. JY]|nr:HPP family protein [Desulfovibrio sp. JY]